MLTFMIYFAGLTSGIKTILLIFSAVLLLCILIEICVREDKAPKDLTAGEVKRARKFFTYAALCLIISLIIPSKETVYLMTASHYASNVPQTEIYSDIMEVLKLKLDDIKKELVEDK